MSELSPSLSLPLIQPAQAQKHVTHNEAVELLDMIVQLTVQALDETVPPAAPQDGQTWGVGAGATAAWTGQDGALASFRGGGWLFVTPQDGWRAWSVADGAARVYSGGGWNSAAGDLNNVAGVGINATSDSVNRLTVASDASLFSHDGAGHQIKVNKVGATDTASLLFQSGWSGRAEMGLAGSDGFAVKVSADGSAWSTAFSADGATGGVTVETLLNVKPGLAPVSPVAGDIYFDAAAAKLRCYDGTIWQDLF